MSQQEEVATDYARFAYQCNAHYQRYKRRIDAMSRKLVCQECRGSGGWIEPILDYGQGPWEQCGWCLGTGYVTPWLRGMWLRCRR